MVTSFVDSSVSGIGKLRRKIKMASSSALLAGSWNDKMVSKLSLQSNNLHEMHDADSVIFEEMFAFLAAS